MSQPLKQEIWEQSKEWINGVGDVVNEMASNLGVGAEHVYTIFTRQMFIEGLIYSIISLSLMIAAPILLVKVFKWTSGPNERYSDRANQNVIRVLATLATLALFFVMLFVLFVPGIMKVFNPEFYTLKFLLDTVQELVNQPGE